MLKKIPKNYCGTTFQNIHQLKTSLNKISSKKYIFNAKFYSMWGFHNGLSLRQSFLQKNSALFYHNHFYLMATSKHT